MNDRPTPTEMLAGLRKHIAEKKLGDRYSSRSCEMLISPAWIGLPDVARRVLERLEVEHMIKRGRENGRLAATYDDLVAFDLRRASIKRAIRQAVALGFLEVTQQGRPVSADVKLPNLYRLTYVHGAQGKPPATNDWRALKTDAAVRLALKGVLAEEAGEAEARAAEKRRREEEDEDLNEVSPGLAVNL